MKKQWIHIATIALTAGMFTSCLKDDVAVLLPAPGNSQLFSVSLQENYEHQVYFQLKTQDTLGNDYFKWDLAFEAADTGNGCWMNGGKLELIGNTATTDFEQVKDTAGYHLFIDSSDWGKKNSMIGTIENKVGNVFIIDRGYKHSNPLRFFKFQFLQNTSTFYEIKFSPLADSITTIVKIYKNNAYSYRYFSFDNGGSTLEIEPVKLGWDLQFTRYRVLYSVNGAPFPYLVVGVLINNANTKVCVDSTADYQSVNYEFAKTKVLSSARDALGYEWKYFDFSTQKYKVRTNYIYIIKDGDGVYWKLRFLDFYNALGKKGFPKFEFQRL